MVEAPPVDNPFIRPIRSFVQRAGRLTPGQQRALDEHWIDYGLELSDGVIDLSRVFKRDAPTVLEIGFGDGQSLLTLAEKNPQLNYIGVEVHRPGVGRLMMGLDERKLTNVRVFCADALDVIHKCISDESLHTVQLFFPDPWHKKRHHKRRIVTPRFVATMVNKLRQGGCLHLATDWEHYAESMLETVGACSALKNLAHPEAYHPRPESRPLTKFENRGKRLGHGVWDLMFEKV